MGAADGALLRSQSAPLGGGDLGGSGGLGLGFGLDRGGVLGASALAGSGLGGVLRPDPAPAVDGRGAGGLKAAAARRRFPG